MRALARVSFLLASLLFVDGAVAVIFANSGVAAGLVFGAAAAALADAAPYFSRLRPSCSSSVGDEEKVQKMDKARMQETP